MEDLLGGRENAIRVHFYQSIYAVIKRCWPPRVLAQREAGHAENRDFVLQSTGICEDYAAPETHMTFTLLLFRVGHGRG